VPLLYVNGKQFDVPCNPIVGIQVRAVAAVDHDYGLVLEGIAGSPDRMIGNDDAVSLDVPQRFYSVPPTNDG
jgi:hypothetical protein